jgi:hypothetical protein
MNEKRKNKPLLFFNGAVEYLDKFSTQELLENNPINENKGLFFLFSFID